MRSCSGITSADLPNRLVKIAILDTGLAGNHKLSASISERYKDFVDSSSEVMMDKTSHGTRSFDLVLKACPDAVIYVARVFENDYTDEIKEPEQMVKVTKVHNSRSE
jgi:hypothetical protein